MKKVNNDALYFCNKCKRVRDSGHLHRGGWYHETCFYGCYCGNKNIHELPDGYTMDQQGKLHKLEIPERTERPRGRR